MLPVKGLSPQNADLWPQGRSANVLRAISLVPDAVRGWTTVSEGQYLSFNQIMAPTADTNRALNRMQIETVAGRVSSINECFY